MALSSPKKLTITFNLELNLFYLFFVSAQTITTSFEEPDPDTKNMSWKIRNPIYMKCIPGIEHIFLNICNIPQVSSGKTQSKLKLGTKIVFILQFQYIWIENKIVLNSSSFHILLEFVPFLRPNGPYSYEVNWQIGHEKWFLI